MSHAVPLAASSPAPARPLHAYALAHVAFAAAGAVAGVAGGIALLSRNALAGIALVVLGALWAAAAYARARIGESAWVTTFAPAPVSAIAVAVSVGFMGPTSLIQLAVWCAAVVLALLSFRAIADDRVTAA